MFSEKHCTKFKQHDIIAQLIVSFGIHCGFVTKQITLDLEKGAAE